MNDFWHQKRVTITGSTGFLGSHLTTALEQAGAHVFKPLRNVYDLRTEFGVRTMYQDAGWRDVVFHLAATVGGIGANSARPADFYYDNTMMNTLLVHFAHRFGKVGKLVLVGSVCAYPKLCPVPFIEENLFEGYPEETNAPYGIAKRGLLVHAQAAREQYGLKAIYVVPTNLYGPGDNFSLRDSHVIPALIRKVVEAKQGGFPNVNVWGDGSASRDFLYVEDCVRALLMAAEGYDDAEPVNVGSGRETTIAGLVNVIKRVVGYEGTTRWQTEKPGGQPRRKLNTRRAERAFGWKAATRLEDGIKRTVEWWLENGVAERQPEESAAGCGLERRGEK